ncbi:CocE/NonD family hydrolase [Granulicella sp. WH15]|uniref:CocE/NonD family hydrolase n=1 Tax=Granulicella sp. WH15 TaxID=2602070 RepID=UPI0013668FD7|nr:CocE/NonD family hydrolase [Granulicella sp. WH15]QHN02977.1 CocE/NonD family hydrolase [Granulicella sp. WH15]
MTVKAQIDCGGGVRLERGVACRMSDGVVLYADHYYPAEAGPHPTLLMRQPYGRDIASTVVYAHPVWFARHGYNVVIQDVRGRGDSEGSFYPFRHEARDGAETIAALIARPESNGKVGMYGFSYQGMTQLLAAAEQPQGLVCIAPAMTAHDLYEGWFYHNGAMRLAATLGWGLQMLKADARRLQLRKASDTLERAWSNLPAQYLATPYGSHAALHGEGLPSYVRDWMEHDRPGAFWSSMDVSERVEKINVPALHLSGWYDMYLKGSMDGFAAMSAGRDDQYLIAGPWVHIPWGDRIGTQSLGADAALDTDAILLRWFNHWLKGTNEFAGEPRVRHFALNEGRWHDASDWHADVGLTFYLHSGGRANSSKGDGVLSLVVPDEAEPPDVFVYDPEVPVMGPGGLANVAGPSNQALLELGNNLLLYTTPPLERAVHVFGAPSVELYCATSACSADLAVKLVCVKPNGEATFVCIGIARSHHEADVARRWTFSLEPTSCVFAVGDRIRIEIASSAYPLYDRNPGTDVAARLADSWNWSRSTQTIFHDVDRVSTIYLPVIA